jgi:predicted GIY-YIG superfamily endonuclease
MKAKKDQYGDPTTHGTVYILALEDQCWYVGHSVRVQKRMYEHLNTSKWTKRTKWTELHKPVALQAMIPGTIYTEKEVTKDLICIYGLDKVRGAQPYNLIGEGRCTEMPDHDPIHFDQPFKEELRLNWREADYPPNMSRNIVPTSYGDFGRVVCPAGHSPTPSPLYVGGGI